MVTFERRTRGVVRYLRTLCGFTKQHVAAGASAAVEVPVRVRDLARYDAAWPSVDLDAKPVVGAYVVDGGEYTLHVGDCVSNGGVWDDSEECRSLSVKVTIGVEGRTYLVL